MTAVTDLQKQRQQDQVQTNFDAAQGYSVTPNQGSVVPNVMQTQSILESMLAAKNSGPNITPPSDAEIRRTSWIASGVMGLLGAIVTGNAASGIAVGMSAALALHDHGNDLRQRGEYINELHQKGFSGPAILKWYETGDNSELDKESQRMEAMAHDTFNAQEADARQVVNNREADKRETRREEFQDRQQERMIGAQDRWHADSANMSRITGNKQEQIAQREAENAWGTMLRQMQNNNNKENQAYQKFKGAIAAGSKLGDESAVLSTMIGENPNAMARLNQVHFFTSAAASSPLDWAQQKITQLAQGGLLTPHERHDLTVIMDNIHDAQDEAYNQAIAGGLSSVDLSDPQQATKAIMYTNKTLPQLRYIQANTDPNTGEYKPSSASGDIQPSKSTAPAESAPTAPDGNKVLTWSEFQKMPNKGVN